MNWWPSGRVLASAYCDCWFDLQWRRLRCALLMRSNMVETAVQCSVCQMKVFARFSSHDKSNIYIYVCVCIYQSPLDRQDVTQDQFLSRV